MHRWIFTALIMLIGSVAFALPVRNPAEFELLHYGLLYSSGCHLLSMRLGFETDYVFNRHLQAESKPHRKIEHTERLTNAAYLALNACNRFDFFTTLGGSHTHIYGSTLPFSPTFARGARLEIETHTDFAWSVGVRGLIWQYECLTIGVEGEYFSSNQKVNSIVAEANVSNYPANVNMCYREWQVGGGLSYKMSSFFMPYIAIKWSNTHASFGHYLSTFTGRSSTDFVILNNLENSRSVGYALGGSFTVCDLLLFTVEWRFKDERAIYVNGQMRF